MRSRPPARAGATRSASLACVLAAWALGAVAFPSSARAQGLDLATAAYVANYDDAAYCGEGLCSPDTVLCQRFDATHVDCVVGWFDVGPDVCGVVVRAVLRGSRIFSGHYGCRGRLQPRGAARFIRFGRHVRLRRFRERAGADEKNLYGLPHYDTRRQVYTGSSLPLTGGSLGREALLAAAMLAAGVVLRRRNARAA